MQPPSLRRPRPLAGDRRLMRGTLADLCGVILDRAGNSIGFSPLGDSEALLCAIGDTSLRLARYFGTSAQMWMNLQAKYDLAIAEDAAAARIQEEVRPRVAA